MMLREKDSLSVGTSGSHSWHGIVPPLLTPLNGPDNLDVRGLERLIDHVTTGGVNGVFVLGTTGEGPCLSRRLRNEMVVRTCRLIKSKVPVLVGVTDCSFSEAVESMRVAAEAGADAVVAAPPFYLALDQEELVRYYRRLAVQASLPLFVYNMPALTKVSIEAGTVTRLLDVERIVGLKDSSGKKENYLALVEISRQRPGWPVFVGHEHLLVDALRAGGAGGVCAGANVFPRHFAGLCDAIRSGNEAAVAEFQETTVLRREIYGLLDRGTPGTIRTLKACLALLGLCTDIMSEPFSVLSAEEKERLAGMLTKLGETVAPKAFIS